MKEYTVDTDKIIYFKPRDLWCIPRELIPISLLMQDEVLINKERYRVAGVALINKSFACSDMDILLKKVLED